MGKFRQCRSSGGRSENGTAARPKELGLLAAELSPPISMAATGLYSRPAGHRSEELSPPATGGERRSVQAGCRRRLNGERSPSDQPKEVRSYRPCHFRRRWR
ncbi:UNVERIFIED_CONTAM: hypothetical protein Sangu_3170300 [Sesamum angustifolium]|uniref:Uncharacterized protein n=1 Tax=Sesamum angustifolium TaxID=2727405 RepID=A0AAW2JU12_9LAMI